MMHVLQATGTAWFHTSVVLVIAWLLCTCVFSFRRGKASLLVRISLASVFFLSFLAFFPVPNFSSELASYTARIWSASTSANPVSAAVPSPGSEAGPRFSLADLPFVPQSAARVNASLGETTSPWPVWIVLFIPGVFMMRHLLGLLSIAWLVRNSDGVAEQGCHDELAQFTVNDSLHVELRSTSRLSAAATAGWFHPVILLPKSYSSWNDLELRAVLAHEVAHIRNRDFVWRWSAGFFAAFLCINPLAHWLCRRLTLEQEIAADRAASEAVGSRKVYARILSELAMRADEDCTPISFPGLLSMNSSTHLFRRIEMLRAKEGSKNRSERFVRTTCLFFIGLVALITSGVRVSAEQTLAERETTATQTQPITPFDVSELPLDTHGAFVVRPSLLLDKNVCEYASDIAKLWQDACEDALFPKIDLSKIAYIAGNLKADIRHVGKTVELGDEDEHEHQLMMTMDVVLIRLHQPEDLVKRLKELFPSIERLDGDRKLFELPPIPAISLGLGPLRVRVIDDVNLAVSFTKLGHEWITNHETLPRSTKTWSETWAASDTGAFTLLVQPNEISWQNLESHPDPVRDLVYSSRFATAGISADARQLTLDLVSANRASLNRIEDAITEFVEQAKHYFGKTSEGEREFLADWLEAAKTERVLTPDPTIRLTGPVSFKEPAGEPKVAKRAEVISTEQVQLHAAIIEVDRQRLQQLELPFEFNAGNSDPTATSSKRTVEDAFPTTHRLVAALTQWLNLDRKAGKEFLDKLRKKGIAKVLAEPVLTTVSERQAGFDDGVHRVFFTPRVTNDGKILMTMDSSEHGKPNPWFRKLPLRPSQTYSFVQSSTTNPGKALRVLQLRAEFVGDPLEVPADAVPVERTADGNRVYNEQQR